MQGVSPTISTCSLSLHRLRPCCTFLLFAFLQNPIKSKKQKKERVSIESILFRFGSLLSCLLAKPYKKQSKQERGEGVGLWVLLSSDGFLWVFMGSDEF